MKQVQCVAAFGTEVGPRVGAAEPVSKFGPESREHPVLRPRFRPANAPCGFRVWGLHASAADKGRCLMELLYAQCAASDVHARTVVACARIASDGTVTYHLRTVATTTTGAARAGRLVDQSWVHTRRHGIDGRVLEARLAPARRPIRAHAGQRRARAQRPGPQE